MDKKELKILVQRYINNFLYNGYFLSIILSNDQLYPWFWENYVQLCCNLTKPTRYGYEVCLDFYGGFTKPREFLTLSQLNINSLKNIDIVEFIIARLENDHYVYSFFDEGFIKNREFSFVHDILVYGYDNSTRQFSVLGFDGNEKFNSYQVDFDRFKTAFERGLELALQDEKWSQFYGLTIAWRDDPDQGINHPAQIGNFRANLADYLHSVNSFKREHPNERCNYNEKEFYTKSDGDLDFMYKFACNRYGMQSYDPILFYLDQIRIQDWSLDYRVFHSLYEHKKLMQEKILYLQNHFELGDLTQLNQEYLQVVSSFNNLRFLALKYGDNHEKALIGKMHSGLVSSVKREKEILTGLFRKLQKYPV